MNAELERLVGRYLEGTAHPEEIRELDQRLRLEPAARRELLCAALLETQLAVLLKPEGASAPAGLVPAEPAVPTTAPVRRALRRRSLPLGVAAAVVLVVLGVRVWRPPALGELTEVSGGVTLTLPRGGHELGAQAGVALRPGTALRTGADGSAVFRYRDGSRLRFYKNTTAKLATLAGHRDVQLVCGAVDAEVLPCAGGQILLEVSTPHLIARVRGTEFRVLATSDSSWLGVRSGEVEVERRSDHKIVVVSPGRYAAVTRVLPFGLLDARCPYWRGQCLALTGENRYP